MASAMLLSGEARRHMTIRERIVGERVALAPLRVADAPSWARWLNDPDTTRYLYGRHRRRPRGRVREAEAVQWGRRMLADPERLAVGLEEVGTGAVVGNARLVPEGRGRLRFSIVIGDAAHRGRGLGGEATRLLCRYGLERMAAREVVLEVDPRNAAAVRAYLTAGFVPGRRDSMRLRAG
jgi:RimJ/RimL family protein N-acetyltransferase